MRIYRIQLPATAVAVQVDLLEFVPATSQMVKMLAVCLGQTSRKGDAQEDELKIDLITGFTTSGSGGSTPAVVAEPADTAWSVTPEGFNTTLATTGTTVTTTLGVWNVRAPFLWQPPPYTESPGGIWIPYNTRAVVRLGAAPAASTTISGYVDIGVVGAA